MENTSAITSLVLLGLVEMEGLIYLYGIVFLTLYLFIVGISFLLVFVVFIEETLHEPMYVLICTLTLSGIFGSSSFFPKVVIDLMTSTKTVSRTECLIQILCLTAYLFFQLCAFTIMAYDQYLAVSHPLQYVTSMTLEKTLKLILASLVFSVTSVSVAVLLSNRLPLCRNEIKNIFCDNMSYFILSCADTSVNNLYGSVSTVLFLIFTIGVIAYSYLRIIMICIKLTKNSYNKAIHTLVTHLLNFSIFLMSGLFIFVRFRLNSSKLPLYAHILLSVSFVLFPPLFSPLIYGLRTKALKNKMMPHLRKMWTRG